MADQLLQERLTSLDAEFESQAAVGIKTIKRCLQKDEIMALSNNFLYI